MHAGGGENSGDVDLNLAPIIDCFTVLITYLLVSASFLSLTAFDVGVAASGQSAPGAVVKDPPLSLVIELDASKQLGIKLSGGKQNVNLAVSIAAINSDWDLKALVSKLEEFKTKWPELNEASVTAEPSLKYKEVVKLVEALKKAMPKLYLAG
jgi:biopolymer transport protein ExbD